MRHMLRAMAAVALTLGLVLIASVPVGADDSQRYVTASQGTSIVETGDECDATGFPIVVCEQQTSADVAGTPVGPGQSSGTGHVTLDFSGQCVGGDGSVGTPFTSSQQTVTVAKRGGELHTTTTADGCFVDFGVRTVLQGSFTITGGTGPFAGATGDGAVSGWVDNDRFVTVAMGWISLVD